ncbi:SDR family oxidoreductase [Salipiger sp. IMCC34102]|uniref:SDR family NAD(P)-dependent oxidoreductase n=1 Tax=Salipiger sp. IMCC34102 TaxID=2510647 RepID=UPI00101BA53E|nr:SDR family NAD(P)-dependent oxidoreductase [Salipiger sp. IMCC34102]RYH01937.1 SDR family oxidoreductase [Salipiger sp. IMCC34102]
MDIRLTDKTALVTGAASGIGAAIAEKLAQSGARVIVADLEEDAAQKTVDRIETAGGQARAIACDVSDAAAVEGMMKDIAADGGLHLLVNNAGIGGAQAPTGAYPVDSWNKVIGVNLTGVFHGLRFGIPAIKDSGGGAIVNVASILGTVGTQGSCAYVAAKHAVVGLTKAAALEHAGDGVRVNAVCPGYINTPLIEENLDDETREGLVGLHPMGRLGEADEIASMVVYLLSDAASFVTGSHHLVDGGYTAR